MRITQSPIIGTMIRTRMLSENIVATPYAEKSQPIIFIYHHIYIYIDINDDIYIFISIEY